MLWCGKSTVWERKMKRRRCRWVRWGRQRHCVRRLNKLTPDIFPFQFYSFFFCLRVCIDSRFYQWLSPTLNQLFVNCPGLWTVKMVKESLQSFEIIKSSSSHALNTNRKLSYFVHFSHVFGHMSLNSLLSSTERLCLRWRQFQSLSRK